MHACSVIPDCTVTHQVPLSVGFSRGKYWSGLPFPPLGDFPNPGVKPHFMSLLHCCQILHHWSHHGRAPYASFAKEEHEDHCE